MGLRHLAMILLTACGRYNFETLDVPPADAVADAPPPEPSMIAWYRMEDNPGDGALDDSAGGDHVATCITGVTCGTQVVGVTGMGVRLSSQQHYRVARHSSFDAATAFTVALWANLVSAPATNNVSMIVTKRYSANHNTWGVRFNSSMHAQFESTTAVPTILRRSRR